MMNIYNKIKIVSVLRSALTIENCNRLLINKAISLFDNNKAIAREVAQMALAEAISSPTRDLLLNSLLAEEKDLCLALVNEWKEKELKAKKAWDTYVEPNASF